MATETAPVIVTYKRLNEKLSKALAKNPDSIIEAAKAPAPTGLEADEPAATDEEAARFMAGEFSSRCEFREHVRFD